MARSFLATLIFVWTAVTPLVYAAPPNPAATAQAATPTKGPTAPAWQQLTPAQRGVLLPLAAEWNQMPAQQRNRLVGVANQYPKMKPKEQQRVRERLTDWAKLKPHERELARERYKKMKQLPPEKHKDVKRKWEQYQAGKKPPPQAWRPTDQPQPYVTEDATPTQP
jgi:hypothetical protein